MSPPDGIVTLMFTDIVGSTALRDGLVAANGDVDGNRLYRERVGDPHNARIRALLAQHNGFEVKTIGDSFMVAFAQPSDAVRCAVAIQRSLHDDPIVAVRIGLHTGVAKYGKHDYDGHAVNIAARVESLLEKGERVYCSGETAAMAKNVPGVRFHSYGPYVLKGLTTPIEIYDALWDDSLEPKPPKQPHQRVPYPWITDWVGRENEMTTLADSLRNHKLVTLHGIGGVGKTRLAVETLLAKGSDLPREVAFVRLENARDEPEGLLTAIRDALEVTEVDAPDVFEFLHGGDRLLLLDNFESVMNAAKIVPRLAATPGVRVLVTSQQPLDRVGEHVVELESLPMNESRELFIRLTHVQPNDEAALKDVLTATDGLPYLIEIVAKIASKRQLRQLARELMEVRAREDESRPDRHASVRACLGWVVGHLPPAERDALARVSIFAGGFDAEAANVVAATPIASLDTLVDASLLRFNRDMGRYSMLPTTRLFARERAGDDAALALTHARWFIEKLARADAALRAPGGKAQAEARRWIGTELENVQQAVAWTEEYEPELFRRAVLAFAIYLSQTYRFSENVRLMEALLQRVSFESTPTWWALIQNNLGNAYSDLPTSDRGENLAKAIKCYEAALRIRTEQYFPADWATTQNNLGIAYRNMPTGDRGENLTKAITCYEAALRVYIEQDFPAKWAMTQNNLGVAYLALPTGDRDENLAKAIACYEAALRVRTEQDFPSEWAMTQNNLGNAYSNLPTGERSENRSKAIACYEAALRVRTEQDFPPEWAETQYNLGHCYVKSDRPEQAIACFEAAARGYAAVGLMDQAEEARQQAANLKSPPPPPAENPPQD